jgi:hypothetical protein
MAVKVYRNCPRETLLECNLHKFTGCTPSKLSRRLCHLRRTKKIEYPNLKQIPLV